MRFSKEELITYSGFEYIIDMYFPGAYTPNCTKEIAEVTSMLKEFSHLKACVLINSNDRKEVLQRWIYENSVLTDFDKLGNLFICPKKLESDFNRQTQIYKVLGDKFLLTEMSPYVVQIYSGEYYLNMARCPAYYARLISQEINIS